MNSLVKIKDAPPYSKDLEGRVLLNSLARATLDKKTGSYSFTTKLDDKAVLDLGNVQAIAESLGNSGNSAGVGVDHGKFAHLLSSYNRF